MAMHINLYLGLCQWIAPPLYSYRIANYVAYNIFLWDWEVSMQEVKFSYTNLETTPAKGRGSGDRFI